MLTRKFAQTFAEHWITAWNSHNLTDILSHYTDDFEMSSPIIASMNIAISGTLKGKQAVTEYWQKALNQLPDLHFELIKVLAGADSIIIYYRGHRGLAAEIFYLDDNQRVYKAAAHYDVSE